MTLTWLGHISISETGSIENLILTFQLWFRAFILTPLLLLLNLSCLPGNNVRTCFFFIFRIVMLQYMHMDSHFNYWLYYNYFIHIHCSVINRLNKIKTLPLASRLGSVKSIKHVLRNLEIIPVAAQRFDLHPSKLLW